MALFDPTPTTPGDPKQATPGDPKQAASGDPTPAASGDPTPAASGDTTPAASGDPTPTPPGDPTPTAPGDTLAATLAKWLIPSVSALFVATGYVVVSAHRDLLGIGPEAYGASDYLAAAAVFLQDGFTILADSVTGAAFPRLDGEEVILIVACLMACIVLALLRPSRFHSWKSSAPQWAVGIVVVLLVFRTFTVLDAPLARIANVLVTSRTGSGEIGAELPIEKRLTLQSRAKGLENAIDSRALNLWTHMVCARMTSFELTEGGRIVPRVDCSKDEAAKPKRSNSFLRDEFLIHSLVSFLLLTLSLQALRRATGPLLSIISLVTLFYLLTLPYSYGKLIAPTRCEFGRVLFKTEMAEPDSYLKTSAAAVMILYRDPTTSKLLKEKETNCPPDPSKPAHGQEVKLWEVPNTEIIAVQEIFWEDVIAWSIKHHQPCPPVRF